MQILKTIANASGQQMDPTWHYECTHWQQREQTKTPPGVDHKRAKELANKLLRDQQLVCGVCDKAKGELFFMCVHHLDTLITKVFPITDTTRFRRINRTKDDLIETVLQPIAERYRGIVPAKPNRQKLGLFYVSLKTYETDSPKYHSKMRPISNYSGDPLADLFGVVGRALMWLIQQTVDTGVLPWIMTRTEDLVPFLRQVMLATAARHGQNMRKVTWNIKVADAEGFY